MKRVDRTSSVAVEVTAPDNAFMDGAAPTLAYFGADRQLLVLWDVDHTLIENGGVSKETYALAFELLTGRPARAPARTDGRTDLSIMEGLLAEHAYDPAAFPHERVRAKLTEAMHRNASRLAERGHMLPGVPDALAALAASGGVVQSVLTGNIMPNAAVKVRLLGSAATFLDLDVGAYGSDDIRRDKLVGVAQAKASAKYHHPFGPANTVLLGDTERDVAAGIEGGAWVIGIATGSLSQRELSAAGAHGTLPDLRDTSALLAKLASVTGLRPVTPDA